MQLFLFVPLTFLCVFATKIHHPVDESGEPQENSFQLTTTAPVDKYSAGGITSFKTNRANVQKYIENLAEKRERRNATWKTYFAEILVGVVLILIVIASIVWCFLVDNEENVNSNTQERLIRYSGSLGISASAIPAAPVFSDYPSFSPVRSKSSVPICSRPACVFGSGAGKQVKGKWIYRENNEAYAPAKNA